MNVIAEKSEQRRAEFDVLKFICAFLVICIHSPFPGVFGQYFSALARIAVPIFFMITGFFYSSTAEKNRELKQIKKVFILVLESNALYFLWKCFYSVISGSGITAYLSSTFTFTNFFWLLLLNRSPFGDHLWYLSALLYVLLIVYAAKRLNLMKVLYLLTPLLLIGDLVLGKYSSLLLHRAFSSVLVRNFLFVGLPYFCIGMLLHKYKPKPKTGTTAGLMFLFSATTLAERYLIINSGLNSPREHYISTTLLAISVFLFFTQVYKSRKPTRAENVMSKIGRDYSAWVYIIHPIFITVFNFVTSKAGIYPIYVFFAPVIIYFISILFASAAQKITRHIKTYLTQK